MTTESKQDTRHGVVGPTSGVLRASATAVVMVLVLVIAGALRDGSVGAWGALAGGGIAFLVFASGTAVVHLVAGAMPSASMLVALLTYTLQVAAMALAVGALNASGVAGDSVSRGWFAVGVITVTAAWLVAQIWHATHLRLPAFDLDVAGHDEGHSPQPEAGAR